MTLSKEIQLSRYVESGMPTLSDFNVKTVDIPSPSNGQLLVKNVWMTVDPYMRGRMTTRKSYIPPFALNAPLQGQAIGIVETSNHERFKEGDVVSSFNGWREYFISNGSDIEKLEAPIADLSHYLGILGMPGLTAFGGLLSVGKPKAGETVFVSAASGAVGSIVCQIAKLKGCKVIASVGDVNKKKWLEQELHVDVAFNYKECISIDSMLKEVAPAGIDIYFKNVGGEHLQAALNHMNMFGRIVMCGMISQYNLDKPEPGPNNLKQIIGKRLILQGIMVTDFEPLKKDFYRDMSDWINKGQMKSKESILNGIASAPQAFLNLFTGNNFGKMLVKL